jgi:hypothetical protein
VSAWGDAGLDGFPDPNNDGKFPEGAAVTTPFPLTDEQAKADRVTWPWVPGTIAYQCGPDEWGVVIEAREVAFIENSQPPAPDGTPDDQLCHPVVFRDSSEIRLRPEP